MNNNDDQKNLPAEQPPPREETRLSLAHGDEKRSRSDRTPPGERSQTLDSAPLLNSGETAAEIVSTKTPEKALEQLKQIDGTYPKTHRLRKPAEFQRVYKNGKRFDARFVTAFVLSNDLQRHRLGITASRKAVGNAVQRNRAKRLLREAFRLSKAELSQLEAKYDFVLNARRNLLKVKMREPLEDFQKIIQHVAKYETAKHEAAQKILANNETAPNVNLTHE